MSEELEVTDEMREAWERIKLNAGADPASKHATDVGLIARALPADLVSPPTTTPADLLDQYGEAMRGSWGDIDGRLIRSQLGRISDLMRKHGDKALSSKLLRDTRFHLDLCLFGEGHWDRYCSDHTHEDAS